MTLKQVCTTYRVDIIALRFVDLLVRTIPMLLMVAIYMYMKTTYSFTASTIPLT